MKRFIAILFVTLLFTQPLFSHCEIPCGIYGDEMRCDLIAEHITTIEKSMNMIMQLSQEEKLNFNQIVRWVNNKENHADEIQHIVSQYFLTQRIKPASKDDVTNYQDYVNKLTLLHEILVSAMKAKQTTDLEHVNQLRVLLEDFRKAYFGEIEKEHKH